MLRKADIFNPAGTLPDVSQSVVLPAGASASALAGINSGADYAKAIYAAAYKPLPDSSQRKADDLDTDPTTPTVNRAALERRNLARRLQASLGGRGRPESTGGSYRSPEYAEPPLPGTEELPVADSGDSGNLLGLPPPTDNPPGLFPERERPTPLLPPALQSARPWNPADIFRNIFP